MAKPNYPRTAKEWQNVMEAETTYQTAERILSGLFGYRPFTLHKQQDVANLAKALTGAQMLGASGTQMLRKHIASRR